MLISVCVWIASFGDLFKHIYTVEFCVSFRRHSRSVDIQTVIPLHCHLHPCTECELCYLLRIVVVNNKFRSIWCEDRVTVSARQNFISNKPKKKIRNRSHLRYITITASCLPNKSETTISHRKNHSRNKRANSEPVLASLRIRFLTFDFNRQ